MVFVALPTAAFWVNPVITEEEFARSSTASHFMESRRWEGKESTKTMDSSNDEWGEDEIQRVSLLSQGSKVTS